MKYNWTTDILDTHTHINGLVQERHNSIANALELRLSCTNPSICICNMFPRPNNCDPVPGRGSQLLGLHGPPHGSHTCTVLSHIAFYTCIVSCHSGSYMCNTFWTLDLRDWILYGSQLRRRFVSGQHDSAEECMGHSDQDHYNEVIMGAIASQITSLTIVYSIVYSDADQRKHQSSASLAFVRGIHRGQPVNSSHKWPVTRKMFPFDDVIMPRGAQRSVSIIVTRIILGIGSASERRHYYVTPPLIGRAHTQNDSWNCSWDAWVGILRWLWRFWTSVRNSSWNSNLVCPKHPFQLLNRFKNLHKARQWYLPYSV